VGTGSIRIIEKTKSSADRAATSEDKNKTLNLRRGSPAPLGGTGKKTAKKQNRMSKTEGKGHRPLTPWRAKGRKKGGEAPGKLVITEGPGQSAKGEVSGRGGHHGMKSVKVGKPSLTFEGKAKEEGERGSLSSATEKHRPARRGRGRRLQF